MLYSNCRYLPIHNFNEVTITGDLTFLIQERELLQKEEIIKKYPKEVLESKWLEILNEYENITQNKKTEYLYKLKAEVIYLQNRVIYLSLILESLQEGYDVTNIINPEKTEDIKLLLASAKNNLNTKLRQLESETIENKAGKQDFEKALAIVKGNGYLIDRFTLPVSEWVEILNNLEKKAKEIEKMSKKK